MFARLSFSVLQFVWELSNQKFRTVFSSISRDWQTIRRKSTNIFRNDKRNSKKNLFRSIIKISNCQTNTQNIAKDQGTVPWSLWDDRRTVPWSSRRAAWTIYFSSCYFFRSIPQLSNNKNQKLTFFAMQGDQRSCTALCPIMFYLFIGVFI